MSYDWDFTVLTRSSTIGALAAGFGVTLLLTFWTIILGTPLGIALGGVASVGDRAGHFFSEFSASHGGGRVFRGTMLRALRLLVLTYIDVIRAIPLLILILVSFYAVPVIAKTAPVATVMRAVGITATDVSPFTSGVIAMVVNLAAFVADLVRASVAGFPRGNVLAGRALGMSNSLLWRRIILPDVFREVFPALTLLWITMFKMSTLCSVITVYEVLHSADAVIQQTYKPLELYSAVALFFVIAIVPTAAIARGLESTQALRRRSI